MRVVVVSLSSTMGIALGLVLWYLGGSFAFLRFDGDIKSSFIPYGRRGHSSASFNFVLQVGSTTTTEKGYYYDYYYDTNISWQNELFNECKKLTSQDINPNKLEYIDVILQRLNSPAPQSFFVLNRAVKRALHNQAKPHDLKMLETTAFFLIKRGYRLVLYNQTTLTTTTTTTTTSSYELPNNHNNNMIPPWEIVPIDHDDITSSTSTTIDQKKYLLREQISLPSTTSSSSFQPPQSTLQIANEILELVSDASERQEILPQVLKKNIIDRVLEQLSWTMGMDLRGRTSADAAFLFALAGIHDDNDDDDEHVGRAEQLFDSLSHISHYELSRIAYRPSFESKYILQIVEKHAAAGTRGHAVQALYKVAADCLINAKKQKKGKGGGKRKQQQQQQQHLLDQAKILLGQDAASSTDPFDLLSPRPLLWLWRFAARQKKAKKKPPKEEEEEREESEAIVTTRNSGVKHQQQANGYPSLPQFKDPTRPLIVDLGCGMGTCVLGLTTTTTTKTTSINSSNDDDDDKDTTNQKLLGDIDFSDCNCLGVDLSPLAVQFATGITSRWKLHDRLAYAWCPAEECLDRLIGDYPGPIVMIMIQFPTPYRLVDAGSTTTKKTTGGGNSQLPANADSGSGFMVSDQLLSKIGQILSQSGGKLLVQSNCEDVAVTIRKRAIDRHGMKVIALPQHQQQQLSDLDACHQTQRNLQWIAQGGGDGDGGRAVGEGWSSLPLLPPRGTTETEVACHLQGTPVHRCLLSST